MVGKCIWNPQNKNNNMWQTVINSVLYSNSHNTKYSVDWCGAESSVVGRIVDIFWGWYKHKTAVQIRA